MGKGYLIDSNVIIDFCNGKLPDKGRSLLESVTPEISIITHIELFGTKSISSLELDLLERFIAIATIYPVDVELVRTTIEMRSQYRLKLPDAIIAATAIVNDLTLVSRNIADFKSIKELRMFNPWEA